MAQGTTDLLIVSQPLLKFLASNPTLHWIKSLPIFLIEGLNAFGVQKKLRRLGRLILGKLIVKLKAYRDRVVGL